MWKRRASVILVSSLCGIACKSNDESTAGGEVFGPGATAHASFETAVGQRFDELGGASAALATRCARLVEMASGGYSRVVAAAPPSAEEASKYDEVLLGLAGDYRKLLQDAHEMVSAQVSDEAPIDLDDGTSSQQDSPLMMSAAVPPQEDAGGARHQDDIEESRRPLLFVAMAVAIPMAVAGYYHMKNIYDARTQPVVERIKTATNEELRLIKASLNLPAEYSQAQTLDYFENQLGFDARLTMAKTIESELTAESVLQPNVRPFGPEVNQAVANSAVHAGRAGVDLVVSGTTSVTGSGVKQIGQAAGLAEQTAATVEMTVQAVQTATGQPLQPLDVFSSHIQAAVNGGEPVEVQLPAAGDTLPFQAKSQLAGTDPSVEETGKATAILVEDMLDRTSGGGNSITARDSSNGGKTVTVSSRTQIVTAENPTGSTVFSVLRLGANSDVTIAAKGHRIQTSKVALSSNAVVKYQIESTTASTNPLDFCARGDYQGAYDIYVQTRNEGDACIVTATCAFRFYDYAAAERIADHGASVSSRGGRAHNYFIAEYAAERQGKSGSAYQTAGLEAAKESGQCGGASSLDACASSYRSSIRQILDRAQSSR